MPTQNVFAETDAGAVDALALNGGETLLPGDPFTVADPAQGSAIVGAIMGSTPGLTIDANSIVIVGGPSSVGYYDGSLSGLGIGAGLLITSGTMPGTSNTVGWFGIDNGLAGDPALDAVINPIFATNSYDATSISFDFTVTDPSITGISFNIVFGTDEYPEWVDQFVDIAVILINGVNVAYFGNDPNAPLSVISQNLAAGYFIDNGAGLIPIEYDGVSNVLTVFAPVNLGVNTITIAIADTGDHIYDSGLFISNLQATTIPTTGVTEDVPCTEGDDDIVGDDKSENFDGLGGDDHLDGAGGDDVMEGGAGSDILLGGSGDDFMDGGDGSDSVDGGLGDDTLQYSGDDDLNGGDGQDTLMLNLSASAAAVMLDLSDSTVQQALADGTTIVNVEKLLFTGGAGNDQITGGQFADSLAGGDGDDILAGGGGGDSLDGGAGSDTAVFSGAKADYLVTLGAGGALVVEDLRPGSPDGIMTVIGVETFQFSNGAFDPLTLISHGETITGGAADDLISGLATVAGQAFASDFADIIFGGAGDDIVVSLGGDDHIDLGADNDIAHAGDGDDTIIGGAGDEEIWGDAGVDTAVFTGNRADYLIVEQGDGYAITDLRPGSPDGQDDLVGVEYATFADGTVKLTIGSAPTIDPAGDLAAQVFEPVTASGMTSLTGAIDFSDADHDDTHTVAIVASSGDQTGVTFQAVMGSDTDGENPGVIDWSVQVDTAAIQALGEGQVRILTYTIRVTDSAGNETDQVVTIQIVGTNDAPIVTSPQVVVIEADAGPVTVDAMAMIADNDLGAKPHVAGIPTGLPPGVSFDPIAQTFTIDPLDPDLLALSNGQDYVVGVDYTVTDGFADIPVHITFQISAVGVTIQGTSGADVINGVTSPAGQPRATSGADTVYGGDGNDVISGLGGGDTLFGENGADTLVGGAGADTLDGGAENDTLNGGLGADITVGGLGNDLHYVDSLGDVVEEAAGQGTADRVLASVSYVLTAGAEVEILTTNGFSGTAAIDLTGNEYANRIEGNAGANTLNGAGGDDRISGFGGADTLIGGDGNDVLEGGAGADTTSGGLGNDLHYVDNAADTVIEAVGEGTDRVLASTSYALAAGVEVELMTASTASSAINLTGNEFSQSIHGNGGVNILDGGGGDDTLLGQGGADTLLGGDGADILKGGAGLDSTHGGLGNDLHYVDQAGDLVFESLGEGSADRVLASVSYALAAGAEVEILTTAAWTGSTAINLTGNEFANRIEGNAGSNVLDGGDGGDSLAGYGGADTLYGGAGDDILEGGLGADTTSGGLGNDLHYVDNAGDIVNEAVGEGTADRVLASVSFSLAAGAEIELMTTTNWTGTAALNLTGNEFGQTIHGNNGSNRLDGGGDADTLFGQDGADVLIGGAGGDVLTGGGGADTFMFNAAGFGLDTVSDFANGTDRIQVTGIAGVAAFSDLAVSANGSGWAVVTFPDGSTITLSGVSSGQVDASDFVFGP